MGLRGQDAWRKHPILSNCHKAAFPGLKPAAAIFVGYCVVEAVYDAITAPPVEKFDMSNYNVVGEVGETVKLIRKGAEE